MSPLTTHVLDVRLGRPATGVAVHLEHLNANGAWQAIAGGVTNDDGRVTDLLEPGTLRLGRHRLTFDVGDYFLAQGVEHFYPQIAVEFQVASPDRHYHVPLLLAPFGFSTYRGS